MGDALQCAQNEDGGQTVVIALPAAATAERARAADLRDAQVRGRRSLLLDGSQA
jgi:hypothetical protein